MPRALPRRAQGTFCFSIPFRFDATRRDSILSAAASRSRKDRWPQHRAAHSFAGGRAVVTLPGFATAESVDLVERPAVLAGFEWDAGARVATVPLRPFGIVSLRLRAEAGS